MIDQTYAWDRNIRSNDDNEYINPIASKNIQHSDDFGVWTPLLPPKDQQLLDLSIPPIQRTVPPHRPV